MFDLTRRDFLRSAAAVTAAGLVGGSLGGGRFAFANVPTAAEVPPGDRPPQDRSVEVLNPRGRVPLSFIIDDSTCLVNMGHFCMPQFNSAWPQNPIYWRKWQEWPREIPDSFVREFHEFCGSEGVRGKYSLVPVPACVGWLDRELPGWSRKDLKESLKLVRELVAPSWDITPEMVTHTRMIDLKTGRPVEPATPETMENSYPPVKKSVDELAAYIAYALQVLKNCEIPCEAITTPGGFGNKCKAELSAAVRQAVGDVFAPEIPHYFKYIADGAETTFPRLEQVEGKVSADGEIVRPRLTVNVPAGCGDWFGGWDGDRPPEDQKYVNDDASGGRMVELIDRGEPGVMFCHWAGLYSHGTKKGFDACKRVIKTVNAKYRDRTLWMKTSELARYWSAKELTRIDRAGNAITLTAPFACPSFTLKLPGPTAGPPRVTFEGKPIPLAEVKSDRDLKPGTWHKAAGGESVACFDLPRGRVGIEVG